MLYLLFAVFIAGGSWPRPASRTMKMMKMKMMMMMMMTSILLLLLLIIIVIMIMIIILMIILNIMIICRTMGPESPRRTREQLSYIFLGPPCKGPPLYKFACHYLALSI